MLADTANLIIRLGLKDETKGQLKNTQTGLSGLQKAAIGVATLGFGAMTKGALQAEEAQGKFMAATGKSREEAKKFVSGMDALAGSAGAVGVSFEDIAETGTMVEQQFGTTGQATTDLTDDILKFAKYTGTDAADAAANLEDALSAFGLEAQDASPLMDKLVASSQRFGTDAGPAAVDALNGMAPALTAMGMGLDDGVELLNAFEVAGGNAGDAAKGLQTAVAQLKPGEDIDDLITKIAAIEDPLLKNQAAVEAFGKKMGPGLAKLIKPGMTSLDDFGVSADEAAGSLDTAAGNMLTTTDKIRGILEKLGAGFREVGQEFGPLVSGVAAIAPALLAGAKAIKLDDFAGVVKDKAVDVLEGVWESVGKTLAGGAADVAGEVVGEAFGDSVSEGAGAAIAEGAGGTIVGNLTADAVKKGATESGLSVGQVFGKSLAIGAILAIPAAASGIANELARSLDEFLFPGGSAMSWYQTQLNPNGAAEQAGASVGEAAGDGMVLEFQKTQVPYGDLTRIFGAVHPEAARVGEDIMVGLAYGVDAKKGHVVKDLEGVAHMAIGAMVKEAENANKVGDALADGLLQGIPDIRSAWKQFLTETENAIRPMKQITWLEGRLAGDKLADALASKNPLTRRRAELMRDEMMAQLDDLKTLMGIEGTKGSNSLANNMDAGPAVNKARGIMQKLGNIFNQDFKIGVGLGVGGGGGNKKKKNNNGSSGRTEDARAEGGPVRRGVPYIVGEKRPELFVPTENGFIIPRLPTSGISRGGGPMTVNVNLFLNGYQLTRAQEHIRRVQGGQVVG